MCADVRVSVRPRPRASRYACRSGLRRVSVTRTTKPALRASASSAVKPTRASASSAWMARVTARAAGEKAAAGMRTTRAANASQLSPRRRADG
jgi:hypothetical protein